MSGDELARYTANYTAVLIAFIFGVVLVVGVFLLSRFLAPRKASPQKAISYECGMLPVGKFWSQLHIRYYLFAILFLIFDVEAVFLFPWALVFWGSQAIFYEMALFLGVLLFGLLYCWRKGVLEWK